MKKLAIGVLALASSGCLVHRNAHAPMAIPRVSGTPRVAFALRQLDVSTGMGATAAPRKCFYVQYTGWLTDGTKFDSSRDTSADGTHREPISFPQGSRRVIAGWDLGFEGMRVGGTRRLFIPYQLGYGEAGRPPVIPAKAELIFDVELVAIADTLPRAETAPRGQTAPPPQCPTWSAVSNAPR
jgi:peptidylprolyl isomerase